MYWIVKEAQMGDGIFPCGNGLGMVPKTEAEVEGEDSEFVLEKTMTDFRVEDDGHLQAGEMPDED